MQEPSCWLLLDKKGEEMSESKLLLNVVLTEKNQVKVTLGTKHEALLALALRKAQLAVDEVLLQTDYENEVLKKSPIEIPTGILEKL